MSLTVSAEEGRTLVGALAVAVETHARLAHEHERAAAYAAERPRLMHARAAELEAEAARHRELAAATRKLLRRLLEELLPIIGLAERS